MNLIDIFDRQNNVTSTPYMGCRQLSEIAIKALSPGINDPGTAILSLNALSDLLCYCLLYAPENKYKDDNGTVRITTKEYSFDEYFNGCVLPIWDYGKNDRMIQHAFKNVLVQMKNIALGETEAQTIQHLLNSVNAAIDEIKFQVRH